MKSQNYVQSVWPYLKDKFVEIYAGSSSKNFRYSDYDIQQKEVIRGVLKGYDYDLLIIEITDSVGNTNNVYINGWSVIAIVEPKNGISIIDIYVDEHEKQPK